MRHVSLVALGVLALAACQPAAEPADAPADAPAAPTAPVATATPAAANTLTSQGWGPLRVGMTKAEVIAAVGDTSEPDAVGGPESDVCDVWHPQRVPEGVMIMLEDGIVTSVWIDARSNGAVKSDRGFGPGDTAEAVRAAYGAAALTEPHKYEGPPAAYITAWTTPPASPGDANARGISYHIGGDGKVELMAGGGASIQYVEGCA